MVLRRFIQSVIEALYPSRCLVCKKLYRLKKSDCLLQKGLKDFCFENTGCARAFQQILQPLACSQCLQDFRAPLSPFCTCCGQMFKSSEGVDHLCENCLTSPKYFEKARAAGIYSGALMTLVHRFKYQKKLQLAKPFQKMLLIACVRNFDLELPIMVVPIPLHSRRLRNRGFNQALLMVNRWGKILDHEQIRHAGVTVSPELLARKKWTIPQTGLSKSARKHNIRDAFEVIRPKSVENQRILLVDDVYTTGSTANECARVLKRAGADKVDVLTLARTM